MTGLAFSAVVGQDQAKLGLLLAAREPLLGGVLLRGDKGSAKTTLARGLAALLPGDAPFVELPLGATEDRVVGSVDLRSLLQDGSPAVRTGLLAAADGGVLYVDEINLLADHLVDVLLDVAVSGVNRIERDGIAHEHPARFVLIGSMNPEEGELRPQLLDRFGLCVDVHASVDPAERALAVRRRLTADRSGHPEPDAASHDAELRDRIERGTKATVSDDLITLACAVALEVGAEGLRADLMLCRAASAHAGWRGAAEADADDLRVVAPLVLGHRRRRSPLEPPGIDQQDIDDAFDAATDDPAAADLLRDEPTPDDAAVDDLGLGSRRSPVEAGAPLAPPHLRTPGRPGAAVGQRGVTSGDRGRFVRAVQPRPDQPVTGSTIAVVATAVVGELQRAVREQTTGNLVILCIDASGSMGATRRIEQAKAAVLGLLTDAYQRRDRVALVTFGGDGARVVLRPTASVEIARGRLGDLPTGGPSPIAEGLDAVRRLIVTGGNQGLDPLVVLVTDGRATGTTDAVERSRTSAALLTHNGVPLVVIDAETGTPRLGLAPELAEAANAVCLHLDHMEDGSLERTIRLQLT